MIPRIGSLFSGYGGLDMGVMAALGGSVAWHVEFDKAPSKILTHHWPDVPNYGDVTAVDWSAVEPVDIITGGSPCQDVSGAGKRAGMTDGTRSNLWVAMREAIARLRPGLVVWENVRGVASATADSALEFCPGCMGEAWDRGPVLRALGRVVGDLAELGYVGRVRGLRVADVGGCHGRFRYFVVAADAKRGGLDGWALESFRGSLPRAAAARGGEVARLLPTPTTDDAGNLTRDSGEFQSLTREVVSLLPTPRAREMEESVESFSARQGRMADAGRTKGDSGMPLSVAVNLLPTPVATDASDSARHTTATGIAHPGTSLTDAIRLLPTPAVNDMGAAYTPDQWDEWTAKMKAAHGNGNGHGPSLNIEAQRLHSARSWVTAEGVDYGPAVHRWEALTRIAPEPTMLSTKGVRQLAPEFSEWMMGLPLGHVTGVEGLSRNDMLKAIGNGVCPQQCAAAVWLMLSVRAVAA